MRMRSSSSERKNFEWPGHPDGRNDRAAGYRCAGFRAVRCQEHRDRQPRALFPSALQLVCEYRRRADPCRAPPIGDVCDFLANTHVGVATELNIGAATRHVGRDRDRARHAGLRDDVCFLLVIACVQMRRLFFRWFPRHIRRRTRWDRRSRAAPNLAGGAFLRFSDFSIEAVPTSTGWPARPCSLLTSSIIASIFFLGGPVDLVVLIVANHRADWSGFRGLRVYRCP